MYSCRNFAIQGTLYTLLATRSIKLLRRTRRYRRAAAFLYSCNIREIERVERCIALYNIGIPTSLRSILYIHTWIRWTSFTIQQLRCTASVFDSIVYTAVSYTIYDYSSELTAVQINRINSQNTRARTQNTRLKGGDSSIREASTICTSAIHIGDR